ncbi:MAG TPA: dephospho-CoA kinase, partial [Dermatophilaceae bacterium]|nr:dephospho-CoA kinase [Dermatophilaceae bacterium]
MLRVGVTGGIGSGKSTAARLLGELGAVVIDADQVARDVVAPGEPALEAIRETFGEQVIRGDGSLDRAGLAAIVFPHPDQLVALETITGPAIAERVARLRAEVPRDDVSVFDMPLLVEHGLWVHEHLNVVVGVDVETRVRRLVEQRGLAEQDVRARLATQASDEDRRAVADVWIDNNGTPEQLSAQVDELWNNRIVPFNENVLGGIRPLRPEIAAVVEPRADWAARGRRFVAKLEAALDGVAGVTEVEHIGSTAVPDLVAKDVIDLQVGVTSLVVADSQAFRAAMRAAGFAESPGNTQDAPHPTGSDPEGWAKRFHGSCDPANVAYVHVRASGSRGWEFALLFRDWLRASPG